MTKQTSERKYGKGRVARRMTALALAAALCFGLLPAVSPTAEAADWMEPYLEQVVEWGVMRGDASGNLNPDRQITRAEFVTMVNRAFGYTEVGANPFDGFSVGRVVVGSTFIVRLGPQAAHDVH